MSQIDTEKLKRQTDIVELINGFVPLKKSGKTYSACCPFHSEKTPSFTVDQEKQFYHCFGCGANGDVIKFLCDYNGYDFLQAAKYLGADVESKPLEQIQRNEKRALQRWKVPPDHCEDEEISKQCAENCEVNESNEYISVAGHVYLPIETATGELINIYDMKNELFLAGGVSYSGAHWNRQNDSANWLAVESYEIAKLIASIYKQNVVTCFTGAVLKYMCKWNCYDRKLKPVLSDHCDDLLAYDMPWLQWDGEKLIKREIKQ